MVGVVDVGEGVNKVEAELTTSSTGSRPSENELEVELELCGTRAGECITELVVGVSKDQASISSRMSETSRGSCVLGAARGTVIVSDLRTGVRGEIDAGEVEHSRVSESTAGGVDNSEGGARAEAGATGWVDSQRDRRGRRDSGRGKVGSSCRLGPTA